MQNNKFEEKHIQKSINIFKLLSDETRMRILIYILNEEKTVSEITEYVQASQSCISHQLKLLKECHMVKCERKGKCILYSLDDDHVRSLLSQTLEHATEER